MAKNYSKRKVTKKSIIALLCALSVTCTGLAAACAPDDAEEESPTTVAKEDKQLLKNGNFEFFDIPDKAVHLIKNANSWSSGGDASVKSGIIGTSSKEWEELTKDSLADTLDYNNDLSSSDEEYVNYNSMRSRDLLYKDNYAAMLESDKVADSWIKNQGYETYFNIKEDGGKFYLDEIGGTEVYYDEDSEEYYLDSEFVTPVRKLQIENPETHYNVQSDDDGLYFNDGDERVEVLEDEDAGSYYYLDENEEKIYISDILMIHNSPTDTKFNGIHQYYTSSTVTLAANTAAKISVWVKTSDLKFDKGYSALNDQDKGAYIEVIQTVGSSTIDSFKIKAINTQKIINGAADGLLAGVESNGWLNYTVYVNACDFASSSIQIRLGLGDAEANEKVTGYAFFDDLTVTRYQSLKDTDYDKTKVEDTTCNLTSEAEDKIFIADRELRGGANADRNAYDFNYAIDLASVTGDNGYTGIKLGNNVEAALTTEKSDGKTYASSSAFATKVSGVNKATQEDLQVVKNTQSRPTANDIIGVYTANSEFKSTDFNTGSTDYSGILNKALYGEKNDITVLPNYGEDSNMLVMLSAWGAAYTSTVSAGDDFTLDSGEYRIVSFWVKTSDMNGKSAATLKIYSSSDTKKEKAQLITLDTTGTTTDFEDKEDIYNGWVQCFFFVKNDTKKDNLSFKIDFCFGNTSITSASAYNGGWAAMANLLTLDIDKEVYNLASNGSTTVTFSFTEEDEEKTGSKFDEANGTSDIKTGISTPSNYTGINGGNSSVTSTAPEYAQPLFDGSNSNKQAGLINREYFKDYNNWEEIAEGFGAGDVSGITASDAWNDVFGKDCYQPLIIINNLRTYADNVKATEDNYEKFYIQAEDGNIIATDGKKYKSAAGTAWDANQTYYSLKDVCNYGYVGTSNTVSANSYATVSVRVKVTEGAVANIYLTEGDGTDKVRKVLAFNTPSYTFHYDNEGNVLDCEYDSKWTDSKHDEHIVYYLRSDGLYEDKDETGYFANLYNLIKSYNYSKFEHNTFYDKDGNEVSFDDLVDGNTYYSEEGGVKEANHYLCNSDGTPVYEYKDGAYYYIVDNETTDKEVKPFADEYVRYDYFKQELKATVTAEECTASPDGWVTVNFVIHTGSESKNYRLELWSGAREETGADSTTGAVAFEYSYYSITSSNYQTVVSKYEKDVTDEYRKLLNAEQLSEFDDDNVNIAYFEKLVEDGVLTDAQVEEIQQKYGYSAKYYTYTLYDSESYVPFNSETAEDGETGYDYTASDFGETLAYFTYNDSEQSSKNVFVDYSAVDQSISIDKNTTDDDDDDDDTTSSVELGLYITSIVLVVVLLITLVSIGITQYLRKHRRGKSAKGREKNVYRKRDRYIKRLHLVKNEEATLDENESENESESETSTPDEE